MTARPLAAFAIAALLCAAPSVASAQDGDVKAQVEQVLGRIEAGSSEQIWAGVAELETMGPAAVADIAAGLERGPQARLGAAKALLTMEGGDVFRSKAIDALLDLTKDSKAARDVRTMAADLLIQQGGKSDLRSLRRVAEEVEDPYVQIALYKGLRSRGRVELKSFLDSDDPALRAEAALALAEMNNIEAAKPILDVLKYEPTERGRRARLYLEREQMLERLEKYGGLDKKEEILKLQKATIERLENELAKAKLDATAGGERPGGPARPEQFPKAMGLLEEILRKVQAFYVDEEKIKEKELGDLAAKGLMEGLDPFSSYMTEDETKAFTESIRQVYAGIGAVVQSDPRTGYLTIVRPIYGGPAHSKGLRTMDRILEVEGQSTKGKTVQELVDVLKGEQGTEVKVIVQHFLGDQTPKEVVIVRNFISLPSASYDLLPGGVGYLQLSQFGYRAVEEVEAAVQDLLRRGMKGLVFDLRGNPGGLLEAAVKISEMFLTRDKLIVYQQGREGTRVGQRREFRSSRDTELPNFPLVILVDESSASASEIVSGALKCHDRAQLVGQQTFGKGSVQQLYEVKATEGKSRVRLTIAYYYLPDGTCIHRDRSARAWRFREALDSEIDRWVQDGVITAKQAELLHEIYEPTPGGVAPHIYVTREDFTREERIKLGELQRSFLVEKYLQRTYLENREVYHKLAIYDDEDPTKYPEFEGLMAQVTEQVEGELTPEHVRTYLRQLVRRFVQDDVGRNLPSDVVGDRQMERGIFEVLQAAGVDAATVPEYSRLAKRCVEAEAAEAKAKAEAEAKAGADKPKGDF